MKVVNLTLKDHANFAFNNAKALQAVGIDCEALTINSHRFGYREQARVVTWEEMVQAAEQADLIQIIHSQEQIYNLIKPLGKRTWVYHTGTTYRQAAKHHNQLLNHWVDRTFTDSPEFMKLGAKDITYIATAIDTDAIKFVPDQNHPLIFAHYPSRPANKGTAFIKSVMSQYKTAKFICDETIIHHAQNMKRIAACDVYIEMFQPKQGTETYGSFGVTAFEAAAMGKSVITNSLYHEVYQQAYGQTGWLHICNTEESFKGLIHRIMKYGIQAERKVKVREWIEEYHSLKATGNYLMKYF